MKFIAAIIATVAALSMSQKTADPIPEKPNQYNRVCDEVAPQTGCWAGNAGLENDPNA